MQAGYNPCNQPDVVIVYNTLDSNFCIIWVKPKTDLNYNHQYTVKYIT